jgi:cytochrome c oxidase subunit 3
MDEVSVTGPTDHEAAVHVTHCDPFGGKMGFWLFLFTEVLLFGMLFMAFSIYLPKYRVEFRATSEHLDLALGGTNTAILLTSSLTMALAIAVLQRGKKRGSLLFMLATVLCAAGFCTIKAFEWSAKFSHGIYPTSPVMDRLQPGEQIFYGLYFVMTGFHAFHVIVGALLILVVMGFVAAGKVHKDRTGLIGNIGLFWHLVDVVWIFLFPLFYLIG